MEVPEHELFEWKGKAHDYCVGIPIINEGDRIKNQLQKMKKLGIDSVADILIFDGNSQDGSTDPAFLKAQGVRTLLVKTGPGKQGAQLRMGFKYVLGQGYKGIVTIDGNGKDSVEDIPHLIESLRSGYDFVQGSRYVQGGRAINTPLMRHFAVKYIHSVWISLLARTKYTDTTNGFRAIKANVLKDDRLKLFRPIFNAYELLFYMSVKIPRLGYKVKEMPVTRAYPPSGKMPSKISFGGNFEIIYRLFLLTKGYYDAK